MSRVSSVAAPPAPSFVGMAERYAVPLPKLAEEVEMLAARVDEHLKKMGFSWK
jgi:hypothetical protein